MKVRRNLLIAFSLLSLSVNAQRIKGSDTVLPVARVTVTGGGTGVGISALMDNTTDIAMASRPIKFSEKMKIKEAGQDVDEIIVAYDALAVVVHPSNPVKQLTRQQLEDIFRGKITNWKQVGGDDRKIVQKLYVEQPFHACHRCHYPVCQPDKRSHRICRSGLCISAYQDSLRIL